MTKYPKRITVAPSSDLTQKFQITVHSFEQVLDLQRNRFEILDESLTPEEN